MVSSKDNLTDPIVSVCVQTYQHASYIRDTLDSVLMQKTDFAFEIVIGEDESTDGTREICIEYAKKYHDKIRLFLNSRKNVIYINGLPTGRRNFMSNLKNARGKYIALLPGDDYWVDPNKLQKQIDFLENHPEFAICFHSATRIVEHQDTKPTIDTPPGNKQTYEIADLLEGNFIVTCSCVFRKGLFKEFPEWFHKMPMGDWPLHIINAQQGYIGYIDEAMSVYRAHRNSYWSSQGKIKNYLGEIEFYNILSCHLDRKHVRLIKKAVSQRYYFLAKLYEGKQNNTHAILSLLKCFLVLPISPAVSHKHLLRKMLRLCFPFY